MNYDKEQRLNKIGESLQREYKEVIVDFILHSRDDNKVLVQKRSMTRSMFPGAWDFPGGHLEPGETLASCIKRLVYEEAEMYLKDVVSLVHVFTWDSDKDVVNIQFLVEASGTFTPNRDKITEQRFVDEVTIRPLVKDAEKSPIYRGVVYAFEYLRMLEEDRVELFDSVLFFDQMISGFLSYMRNESPAPIITIGKENEKKFSLDKQRSRLSISPSFIRHYDNFGAASIILHLVFHNYEQNILAYEDVKSIRKIIGKNIMFYVDIVADVYTYLYLERYYDFDEHKYRQLNYQLLEEYRGETIDDSKFTRLLGSALTIQARLGQGFDVVLPALDPDQSLSIMIFDRSLRYKRVALSKDLYDKAIAMLTLKEVSEKDFYSTMEKLVKSVSKRK